VKTLADGKYYDIQQTHEVTWNGTNNSGKVVGSGIYRVHIKAGAYEGRAKVAVIK